jgi:hypothetical protein
MHNKAPAAHPRQIATTRDADIQACDTHSLRTKNEHRRELELWEVYIV